MDRDAFLDSLRLFDVNLFTVGGTDFTAASLLKLLLLVMGLFWLASLLRRWTVRRVLTHTPLDEGSREAFGSVVRYVVIVTGLLLILQNVGVKLTSLSVVAGAVGVGVGFGLQNVFSNFISGLIIMLERPIKVGDRVEVGGIEGTVREIGARRTTIVTHDNVTILVPNQKLIVDNVVNLVYAEAPLRLKVPVAIAAGTDIPTVRTLLLDAAAQHEEVLKEPAPEVLLPSLGTASMTFELTVWHQPRGPIRQQLLSDLNFLIGERLAADAIRHAGVR